MNNNKLSYQTGTDIVALSTPYATSALCVIRASGNGVKEKIGTIFSAAEKLKSSQGGAFFYGKLQDPVSGKIVDEVILLYAKAPRSYTGEDVIEIMGHGSLPGIDAILSLCLSTGMRQALPGEFTFRSFINGKIDLTQAEAVHEIVVSSHEQAHLMALKRLGGSLTKHIDILKNKLVDFMAHLNIHLDYAEDEVDLEQKLPLEGLDELIQGLKSLEASYEFTEKYKNGFRLILAGKTNAGKSSIFNLLLRQDRSIVSSVPGTTRDYVESQLVLKGHLVCLFDTAGLRETEEEVEKEGIRRSRELLTKAQLLIYVHDATQALEPEELAFMNTSLKNKQRVLVILNKVDLLDKLAFRSWRNELKKTAFEYVFLSANSLEGLDELKESIISQIKDIALPATDQIGLQSKRQYRLIKTARKAVEEVKQGVLNHLSMDLLAFDCHRALNALGELTGEVSHEDILQRMFSSFCVGK